METISALFAALVLASLGVLIWDWLEEAYAKKLDKKRTNRDI